MPDTAPITMFGIPTGMWAFLVVGVLGGFFAGRWHATREMLHKYVAPALDRERSVVDRTLSEATSREMRMVRERTDLTLARAIAHPEPSTEQEEGHVHVRMAAAGVGPAPA